MFDNSLILCCGALTSLSSYRTFNYLRVSICPALPYTRVSCTCFIALSACVALTSSFPYSPFLLHSSCLWTVFLYDFVLQFFFCSLISFIFQAACAKLRKATISFVTPACLSVRVEKPGSHWTDFHEILYLSVFRKSGEQI